MQVPETTITIFIAAHRDGGDREVFFLDSLIGKAPEGSALFNPKYPFKYNVRLVDRLDEADLVMIPQAIYGDTAAIRDYLAPIVERAKKAGKPVVVWVGGDLSHNLNFPGVLMLRSSQYRKLKRPNDIIIPPFCEDLGSIYGIKIREKGTDLSAVPNGKPGAWLGVDPRAVPISLPSAASNTKSRVAPNTTSNSSPDATSGEKPVISFCGWAGFAGWKQYLKYVAKNLLIDLKKIIGGDTSLEVFKKGIYFRRRAIRILPKSNLVRTSFIIRKSFSGNAKTISLSPEIARKEYVENMINSDFVLCPKGDGNHSVRFFEALSLGRIPILIDTDVCLPFENDRPQVESKGEGKIDNSSSSIEVDYNSCILRVSYKDMARLPEIIASFYAGLSPEKFAEMQKNARELFVNYLRYDSFLNKTFAML